MRNSRLLAAATMAAAMWAWPAAAQLTDSGPVVVNQQGQIVSNLRIAAPAGQPCIQVSNFQNVRISNIDCTHSARNGFILDDADGVVVTDVKVKHVGTQVPLPTDNENNIIVLSTNGWTVTRAKLEGGSSGIFALESPNGRASFIQGRNFRGPLPRGQVFQVDKSSDCLLEDFSVVSDVDENPDRVAWTEDNVSIYESHRCIVRRGLIDGNNSPSGVGVMCERCSDLLVEDVDAVRMSNGAFSSASGINATFRDANARENSCTGFDGRGAPLSDGLIWAAINGASGTRLEASKYFAVCNPTNLVFDRNLFTVIDIAQADFTPRAPLNLVFAWEGTDPPPPTDTTPPTVSWISPSNGACFVKGTNVAVEVAATDESGIDGVDFLVNGTLQHSWVGQATGTYTHVWRTGKTGGNVTLTAEAFDMAGNEASASISVRLVNNSRQCN